MKSNLLKKRFSIGYFLITLCSFVPLSVQSASQIVGWVEPITIFAPDFKLETDMKVDTGADNSSLHASHIQLSYQDQQPWVRFQSLDGRKWSVPLYKMTQVKTKANNRQARYLVRLTVCLAGTKKDIPVNLVDRSHFQYGFLLGRSAMPKGWLIDPNRKYLTRSVCY